MRKHNLNALRMFDAAARHLNFARAAGEQNLTQGAVAQQVRRLESDLGTKLFHRQARGLSLTQAGKDYHRPIARALEMIDEATRELQPASGIVRLSVTPSLAAKWLVPRLGAFTRDHPEIDIQVEASEEVTDLHAGTADIAIRQGRPPAGAGLRVERLAPLDLRAVCSRAYTDTARPIERLEDFATHPLIEDSHKHWSRLFAANGLAAPRRMLQFNQTALAMDAAANGQGVALAPALLLGPDLAQKTLIDIWRDARTDAGGFYVVVSDTARSGSARDAVVSWVLSEVQTP